MLSKSDSRALEGWLSIAQRRREREFETILAKRQERTTLDDRARETGSLVPRDQKGDGPYLAMVFAMMISLLRPQTTVTLSLRIPASLDRHLHTIVALNLPGVRALLQQRNQ